MADQKAFKKRLKKLMVKPENAVCADCPERQPRWASLIKPPPGSGDDIGMGAFMCLECSGAHRRLGVHISFVRSINLDSWKEHEVRMMENGGNKKVNVLFESLLQRSGVQKISSMASGPQRERYIRDKYERRKFYDPSALENLEESEEESDEEQPVARRKRSTVIAPRAPSEAAQRRAAQRQARLAGKSSSGSDRPARINKKKVVTPKPSESAPATDLLDFGSMQTATVPASVAAVVTQPPAAAAPTPAVEQNESLDLFANMTVTAIDSAAGPAPAPQVNKSNDDIMSLFNVPQPTNNMMGSPQMMMMMGQQQQQQQQQQKQQPQMNPMMQQMMNQPNMMNQQQMMNQPNMMNQQQMMNQQRMMMLQQQQQQMARQNVPQALPQQGGMMGMNQMQGMPQQQQNMMMMMNNMANQQMNPMMMQQQKNMQAMMQMQQQQQQGGMTNLGQQVIPNGNQAMMGSAAINPPIKQEKEDPFSQFGFNAFR
eukprot:CAMPEP_0194195138 /NCGR_PEP_ID=MMETSP0154-20130528/75967_1 /TAXON_ID=1049557 /ORGANISM="Thalassiothrix antarctica, Strain L6-D1" /LENGTH=483 /DNA_ID=CAMNT_0038919633 /DNA_START=96 /DNA_END=1547 /DNA_ORIENTATION=-